MSCAKTAFPSGKLDCAERIRCVSFGDALAALTNKGDRLRARRVLRHAGEKRVAAFKAVHKARALQHVENAIDGDWRKASTVFCETVDQIVGADGLMTPGDMAEHLLTQRRPLDPEIQASHFRAAKRVMQANAVIVIAGRKGDRLLSNHSADVMLFCIFGNSLRLNVLDLRRISTNELI